MKRIILCVLLLSTYALSSCAGLESNEFRIPEVSISKDQISMQRRLAQWYNTNLRSESPDIGFEKSYFDVLHFEDEVIGYLEIDGVAVYPIYHSPTDKGICMDKYSSFPIGGTAEKTNLYGKEPLRMKAGDIFKIHIIGDVFTYKVGERSDSYCILNFGTNTIIGGRIVGD